METPVLKLWLCHIQIEYFISTTIPFSLPKQPSPPAVQQVPPGMEVLVPPTLTESLHLPEPVEVSLQQEQQR
jgi:hypothetical protein